jgi:alcohol dehydrogenase (cytochrome c)
MWRFMSRGSGLDYPQLLATRDPYAGITAPPSTPARVQAGRQLFSQQCAECHGGDAMGGFAPNLTAGNFTHGASDWALYQTIAHGIPGTSMQGHDLPLQRVWELVSFLHDSAAKNAASVIGTAALADSALALNVDFDRLKSAQQDPGEWLTYSGSYDSQRHSLLAQITPTNANTLRVKWIFQFPELARSTECTPVVVGNIMFVTLPPGDVWALDIRTGEKLWSYSYPMSTTVKNTPVHNRGVAVLGNVVYLGTLNAHLIALNAQTGKLLWDVKVANNSDGYGITSAPLALNDQIVIGVSGADFGIRGFIDAYSPNDGRRLWRFWTVPGPDGAGHETWAGESWKKGGASTWLTGSYDPELGLIYWGVGNPGPDYQGDGRLGTNLYTCSVIALDAATGTLRWYFQFTPHDEHDWDSTEVPILADARYRGQRRKLLYFANRNAFFYVLDRTNGKFLGATAFARQTWASGFTPSGAPIETAGGRPTVAGSVIAPNSQGATNWWSPTYDSASNTEYIPVMEGSDMYKKGAVVTADRGDYLGGSITFGTPWTAVRALDAETGHMRWEYKFPPRERSTVMGGLLSTSGGIVFGGDDSHFVALDSRTGKELWRFNAGGGIAAAPITYLAEGHQQVTLLAGMTVLTFSLNGR